MFSANHPVQIDFTRSFLLRTIKSSQRIRRQELVRKLAADRSFVSGQIEDLVEQGIVFQHNGPAAAKGAGPNVSLLELNKNFCCFLGIEIQPSRYRAVILNLEGEVLSRFAGHVSVNDGDFAGSLAKIYKELKPSVAAVSCPLAAVGIALPGYINPHDGTVIESVPFGLRHTCIASIENPWSVPTFVENDANCCAWAEMLRPCAENGNDFLAMLIEFQERNPLIKQEAGVSIGFGLVANASLYYGESYMAGEFHSLFWRKGNKSQIGISDERLSKVKDDPSIFDDVLEEVLLNLSPVISLLAPSRIVLCGDAAKAKARIDELVATKLSRTWLAEPANADLFSISNHEFDVAAVGAAGRIVLALFAESSEPVDGQVPGELCWRDVLKPHGKKNEYSVVVA